MLKSTLPRSRPARRPIARASARSAAQPATSADDRLTIRQAADRLDIDPTALRRWLQGGRKGRSTTDRAREFDVRRGADETTTVSRAAVERYLAAGVDPGPGHLRLPPAPRTRGVRPRRAWIGALAPVLSASLPRAEALDPHGASGAPQLSLSLG